jgi:UDP-N-acetylmuramate: L-alanyl-gamma-D-glutamyl-meso-diaminopimelate ligase
MAPGFLIGGVPQNFGETARLGDTPFFVIEADEYDTAFFDKRSKFVHYHPRTLVMNNLEFDHADIFDDLAAIQRQFHHLIRTVPSEGLIIHPKDSQPLNETVAMGCWTPVQTLGDTGADWRAEKQAADGSEFSVYIDNTAAGTVRWSLLGDHNVNNALAAIAAARHVGVTAEQACAALSEFGGVKRRLELRGEVADIRVYDDFAHHPTAVATTLKGLRDRNEQRRVIAILEPRSNTMRMGVHQDSLAGALSLADQVLMYQPADLSWSLDAVTAELGDKALEANSIETILDYVAEHAQAGDDIVVMSNGGFANIHQRLLDTLNDR